MDTAQWPQDTIMKPMEEMSKTCSIKTTSLERKAITRPQKEQAAVNCPRCNSTNTKFCYYNNYSLTQPRYFCKTCRRYWTEGGTLRNIPVGGGSRKNKRSVGGGGGGNSSSSPSTSTTSSAVLLSSKKIINLDLNPKIHEAQDLNLGFSTNNSIITQDFKTISELIQVPNFERKESCSQQLSALEMITGISSRGGGGGGGFKQSFFPMQNSSISTDPAAAAHEVYSNGFSQMLLPDFKQSLSFSLEGFGNGGYIGNLQSVQETNGRFLFPFEDLKQVSGTTSTDNNIDQEINRDQNAAPDSNGYWNGVIGGGSW